MKKTIGSMVLIDTNPPRFNFKNINSTNTDINQLNKDKKETNIKPKLTDPDPGNQATLLFFPIFASFLLILLSNLSTPIMKGLNIMTFKFNYKGENINLNLGNWGWCLNGMKDFDNTCSNFRGFNLNFSSTFEQLPENLKGLKEISNIIKGDYLIANGVMHIFATLFVWLTLNWTLASSGSWNARETRAYNWTRWAFILSGYSSLFILIAWSFDIGMLTKIQSKKREIQIDGINSISIIPGPAIYMNLFSFLLCLGSFIVRMTWSRYKPRPGWTLKGNSDFHIEVLPPQSAALSPNDDLPPTW
nr:uncharacterized protein I206_04727 [Kwoniella pini CBS 10737]OCF49040.1 hypothetical protein I206_04727 [Kwoniella pini CBS 10737]